MLLKVVIVLLVLGLLSLGGDSSLSPSDPEVQAGDNITLTCTLTSPAALRDNITIQDLFFEILDEGGKLLDLRNITEIVGDKINLHLIEVILPSTEVIHQSAKVVVKCCYKSCQGPDSGVQDLHIVDAPRPVDDFKCVVYYRYHHVGNQHTHMKCSFTDISDDIITETVKFFWTEIDKGPDQACVKPEIHGKTVTCIWDTLSSSGYKMLMIYETYYFRLTFKSWVPNSSLVYRYYSVEPKFYIKPYPLEEGHMQHVASRNATISWKLLDGHSYVNGQKEMVFEYHLNVTAEKYKNKNFTLINKTQAILTDLHPYENYSISIQYKPQNSGFWSDPLSVKFNTLSSAPSAPPIVVSGTWEEHSVQDEGERWTATVCWQDIPADEQNAPQVRYECEVGNQKILGTDSNTCQVSDLDKDEEYTITVTGITDVGKSPQSQVVIGPKSKIPKIMSLEGVSVDNDKTVNLTWETDVVPDSVTVFWFCEMVSSDSSGCQTEWKWKTLSANTSFFAYTIAARSIFSDYQFAVAVTHDGYSSGMTRIEDTKCIFPPSSTPVIAPNGVRKQTSTHTSMTVSWDKPTDCTVVKANIISYTIKYKERLDILHNCTDVDNTTIQDGDSLDTLKVEDLKPSTSYCYQVTSRSKAGLGLYSDWQIATTSDAPNSGQDTGLNNPAKVAIIAISVTFVVLLIGSLTIVCIVRKYKSFISKKGQHITVPPVKKMPKPNHSIDLYQKNVENNEVDNKKQQEYLQSQLSDDSGRGSVSSQQSHDQSHDKDSRDISKDTKNESNEEFLPDDYMRPSTLHVSMRSETLSSQGNGKQHNTVFIVDRNTAAPPGGRHLEHTVGFVHASQTNIKPFQALSPTTSNMDSGISSSEQENTTSTGGDYLSYVTVGDLISATNHDQPPNIDNEDSSGEISSYCKGIPAGYVSHDQVTMVTDHGQLADSSIASEKPVMVVQKETSIKNHGCNILCNNNVQLTSVDNAMSGLGNSDYIQVSALSNSPVPEFLLNSGTGQVGHVPTAVIGHHMSKPTVDETRHLPVEGNGKMQQQVAADQPPTVGCVQPEIPTVELQITPAPSQPQLPAAQPQMTAALLQPQTSIEELTPSPTGSDCPLLSAVQSADIKRKSQFNFQQSFVMSSNGYVQLPNDDSNNNNNALQPAKHNSDKFQLTINPDEPTYLQVTHL